MKKFIAIMMALVMVLSMAACGEKTTDPTNDNTTDVDSGIENDHDETVPPRAFEGDITYFHMSICENADDVRSLTAYVNEVDGEERTFIEYVGDEKKAGMLDIDAFDDITKVFNNTELKTLDRAGWAGEGEASYSMLVEFSDGEVLMVDYIGEIPDDYKDYLNTYINGYNTMDSHFKKIAESMRVFVPQPYLFCNLDLNILNEALNALNSSGMTGLDSFAINDLDLNDEGFSSSSGLTNSDGAVNAICVAPRLTSDPYSMTVVEFEGAVNAETIGTDFEKNIDWKKWDGATPTDALIATKDNMVLCLQAAGDMYSMTVNGLNAEGWTVVNEFKNPGV
jgi:predicted small lipoprotein YifL